MNEQEQRIAIAEACGWQDVVACDDGKVIGLSPGFTEDQCPEGADEDVPDYLYDLNAMHEAESCLTSEQLTQMNEILTCVVVLPDCQIWRTTAAQRAEAFLRTIGKWRD